MRQRENALLLTGRTTDRTGPDRPVTARMAKRTHLKDHSLEVLCKPRARNRYSAHQPQLQAVRNTSLWSAGQRQVRRASPSSARAADYCVLYSIVRYGTAHPTPPPVPWEGQACRWSASRGEADWKTSRQVTIWCRGGRSDECRYRQSSGQAGRTAAESFGNGRLRIARGAYLGSNQSLATWVTERGCRMIFLYRNIDRPHG